LRLNLPAFPANLRKQLKGAQDNYPAPKAIMCAAVEGAQVDFRQCAKIEGRYFTSLVVGKHSEEHDQGLLLRPAAEDQRGQRVRPRMLSLKWKTKKVGILGAGMMGQGIAYVSAMWASKWCC
jgi:3-hydroxyacyl-CoA dehydrogenase/enoyl-CoA hydratase/3-hydroxybutyryl-CoA epimerase